jgi:hypothetical protein
MVSGDYLEQEAQNREHMAKVIAGTNKPKKKDYDKVDEIIKFGYKKKYDPRLDPENAKLYEYVDARDKKEHDRQEAAAAKSRADLKARKPELFDKEKSPGGGYAWIESDKRWHLQGKAGMAESGDWYMSH